MESQRGTEIKVGLFVIVALCVGSVLVFMIGSATQMFDKQVSLYTYFDSVSGLKVGSQVRLAGLKVGVVDRIWIGSPKEVNVKYQFRPLRECVNGQFKPTSFTQVQRQAWSLGKRPNLPVACPGQSPGKTLQGRFNVRQNYNPKKTYILVRMKVVEKALLYINGNSSGTIKGKGLLGDSLVELSMGSKPKPGSQEKVRSIGAEGFVYGATPASLSDTIAQVGDIASSVKRSLASVEDILTQYKDPTLSGNLKNIVSTVNTTLKRVEKGPGLVHDLFYSKKMPRNLNGAIAQVNRMTYSLKNTARQIDGLIYRSKRRGTLLHSLLISRKGDALVRNFNLLLTTIGVAGRGLARLLQAPQRKGTLLYKLLYTRETSRLITNVVKSTDHLRTIMRDIRAGKGTLGAIINDPTAFEDFKTILGQVKRSRIFKTLIRFIIKRDDSTKGGRLIPMRINRKK